MSRVGAAPPKEGTAGRLHMRERIAKGKGQARSTQMGLDQAMCSSFWVTRR